MKFKPKCKLCQSMENLTKIAIRDESVALYCKHLYLVVCQECKDYVLKESKPLEELDVHSR